jgi:two-component system phosphate regulon sensor histidine kinase PhoR
VRVRSALRLARAERELATLRHDFASMLAHDLRAPLDGLRLTLGVLRRQEDPASPRWGLLDLALGAVEDASGMVDDLLHANRLEDEGFQPELTPLALGPLVARGAAAMHPLATERGLALEAVVAPDLPLVQADAALVKRVLDNLIGNAIKFTPAGAITVTAAVSGDAVALTVRDTGPGIPAERKAKIFDRYFHVATRRETRQGGFGLGLAFCERAIAAMGGTIRVEDAPGGGAAFVVWLPALREVATLPS